MHTKLTHLAHTKKKKKKLRLDGTRLKIKLKLKSNFYIKLTYLAQKLKKFRLVETRGAKLDSN